MTTVRGLPLLQPDTDRARGMSFQDLAGRKAELNEVGVNCLQGYSQEPEATWIYFLQLKVAYQGEGSAEL